MASSSDAVQDHLGDGSLIQDGDKGTRCRLTKQNTDETVKKAIRDNFRGPEWGPVKLTQTYLEIDVSFVHEDDAIRCCVQSGLAHEILDLRSLGYSILLCLGQASK